MQCGLSTGNAYSWNGYHGDVVADVWNDLGSLAIPTTNYLALRVAEYAFIADGTYRSAIDRVLSYFITDLEIGGEELSDDQKERWETFYAERIDYRNTLHICGLDGACYGNAFISVLPSFRRSLYCPRCFLEAPLKKIYNEPAWRFKWQDYEFNAHCPRCAYSGVFRHVDRRGGEDADLIIKRWNPHEMEILWDPYTDQTAYIWKIPEDYRKFIREGKLYHLERATWEVIQAVKNNNYILFDKEMIYHMRDDALAGVRNRGWGISKVLLNFRQMWQVQVLKRYNEALCLDYIIPFRLLTPAPGQPGSGNDPLNQGMANMAGKVGSMLARRKRDPAAWHFLPFPMQYQALGGDATKLAPKDLMDQAVDIELNNVGVPSELYRGTMTLTGAPVALRLFEVTHSGVPHNLNGLLRFLTERFAAILNWEKADVKLQRVSHADDLSRQQAKLQLMMGGALSQSTGLRSIGAEYREEVKRMAEDSRYQAEINAKLQEQMQAEGTMAQMTSPPQPGQPGQAGAGGQPGQAPAGGQPAGTAGAAGGGGGGGGGQPAGGQPAGTAGAAGGGGGGQSAVDAMAWQPIGPHEEITIEELQERAQSIASQIMGMSQAQRSSQLRKLKNIDSTLWSIVKSLISDWRQQAKSQGQEQVLGQAFGKQGSWEEHLKGLPPRPKRRLILLD